MATSRKLAASLVGSVPTVQKTKKDLLIALQALRGDAPKSWAADRRSLRRAVARARRRAA